MSGWLASVTGAEEARLALAAGADLIDCKNPAAGALGALPRATVAEVLAAVGGRRPVSATIGDFPDMAVEPVVAAAEAMAATGVDYVKIGLFPAPGLPDCLEALAALARRQPLVAVLFADRSPDFGLLPRLARNGFAGVMLDTAGKTGAGLLDHQPLAALAAFLAAARRQGLLGGLAGSLGLADIARLRPLGADYLGFRGALCAGGRRQAGLDQAALARVARALAVPMAEPA